MEKGNNYIAVLSLLVEEPKYGRQIRDVCKPFWRNAKRLYLYLFAKNGGIRTYCFVRLQKLLEAETTRNTMASQKKEKKELKNF